MLFWNPAPVRALVALLPGFLVLLLASSTAIAVPEDMARYLELSPDEDTALLDETLIRVFGLSNPPSNEASALAICAFVAQSFGSAPAAAYYKSGTAVLRGSADNLCGDKSVLMTALCRRAGMPVRRLVLYNFETINSHIAVEVYYDEGWHFVDPTLGLFAYTMDSHDGSGSIPSRTDLLRYPELRENLFFVGADRLWKKKYTPESGFVPVPTGFKAANWQDFTVRETYRQLFGLAFPVQEDKDDEVSFPLTLNLTDGMEAWIGSLDGASGDCQPQTISGSTRRFSAIHFIGKGDLLNVFHTLLVHTAAPGKYRLTYHFVDTFPATDLSVLALKDAWVDDVVSIEKGLQVELITLSKDTILQVRCSGAPAVLDAIQLESLPVESL